jgi:DAHL domain-containing protein
VSRNGLLAIGVLLIALAVWLVDALQLSPRAANPERDAERIDALLGGRVALEMSVLEARAGLLPSFDPLNRALGSLRDAAPAAQALEKLGASYAAAAERLALAAAALTLEEAGLEQFKTDLALLSLSAHDFPRAADALTRRAEDDVRQRRRSPLAGELATLGALRSDMERYQARPAQDVVQRLERGLSRLQAVRAALDDAAREELDLLSGHARAVLDRRERVDRFARSLVRAPVRAHLEAARAALERSTRQRARRVGALQVLSALLALAGIGVLGGVVLSAARARARSRAR